MSTDNNASRKLKNGMEAIDFTCKTAIIEGDIFILKKIAYNFLPGGIIENGILQNEWCRK